METLLQSRGATFRVRPGSADAGVVREVGRGWYTSFLKPGRGDVVLDLGGHIGTFAVQAAQTGAKVLTVEAHPDNAELLRENVARNGYTERQIRVVHAAVVHDERRFTTLRTMQAGQSGSHTTIKGVRSAAGLVRVPAISIAKLLTKNPTKVKIDCEGSEYAIIEAIAAASSVRAIAMEAHVTMIPRGAEHYRALRAVLLARFSEVYGPATTEARHVMVYAKR